MNRVTFAELDDVLSRVIGDCVVAAAVNESVGAVVAREFVVARAARQRIVAAAAFERVVFVVADEIKVARRRRRVDLRHVVDFGNVLTRTFKVFVERDGATFADRAVVDIRAKRRFFAVDESQSLVFDAVDGKRVVVAEVKHEV